MNIHCPECEALNRESDPVCSQCGHRLQVDQGATPTPDQPTFQTSEPAGVLHGQRSCPQCSATSRVEAAMCWQCGHRFKSNSGLAMPMNRITIPLLFVAAFASGLALGLNIHPPDQYELEKGYKAGYAKGQTDGGVTGFTQGKLAGMTSGKRLGYAQARDDFGGSADVLRKQITKLEQDGSRDAGILARRHKQEIEKVRAAAHDKGRAEGSGEKREEHRAELVKLKNRHRGAMARAEERGYERGLSEDGYEKGRNSGFKDGVTKARSEAEAVCDSRVRIAATKARDAGLIEGKKKGISEGKRDEARDCEYQITAAVASARTSALAEGEAIGFKKGDAHGFTDGQRQGYDDGHKSGYYAGHNDGYIKGWDACGCK